MHSTIYILIWVLKAVCDHVDAIGSALMELLDDRSDSGSFGIIFCHGIFFSFFFRNKFRLHDNICLYLI